MVALLHARQFRNDLVQPPHDPRKPVEVHLVDGVVGRMVTATQTASDLSDKRMVTRRTPHSWQPSCVSSNSVQNPKVLPVPSF